jgi:predicted dehydrogenase
VAAKYLSRENAQVVGIIGAGMGAFHAKGYKKCPDVEIKTICDMDLDRAKSFAEEHGVKNVCADFKELLADDEIAAVSVCTPNILHAPMTIAAFDAGKHVICEKPIAMKAVQARAMVEAGKKSGKIFMMAFNNRFRGDSQLLKKLIENGNLGDIYYAKTGWLRRTCVEFVAGKWFTDKSMSGGGPLIDLGVHMLDLALWLMGNPKPVYVCGSAYSELGPKRAAELGKPYNVEDLASAIVKLENGATIFLEASWESHIGKGGQHTQFFGTKGGAEMDPLRIYTDIEGSPADIHLQYPEVSGHEMEIVHFVECIRENKTPISTGEHGLHVQLVLDAIYESTRTGKGVEIN